MSVPIEVLVDSTFLLPTLGVRVAQISESDLRELVRLRSKTKLLCIHQSLIELLGKVAKEWTSISDENVLETVEDGLRSLLDSGVYTWMAPSIEAVISAVQIRRKGHKDMIDNLLYSTASDLGVLFLSLDTEFINFLEHNQYSTERIVDLRELRSRI